MFINIQDNRHFRKLLTKQKYSSVVTTKLTEINISPTKGLIFTHDYDFL